MTALRRPRLLAVGVMTAVLVAAGCSNAAHPSSPPPTGTPTASSSASSSAGRPAYLALGDSVPFGFRESATTPAPDYHDAVGFVGYPELVGPTLHLTVTNLACPGETSASYLRTMAQSNGCENRQGKPFGYRTVYPLHATYTGSQRSAAVQFLRSHPRTRLVSLMLGANDGFVCQQTTADHCSSELPGVVRRVGRNVTTALRAIRHTAHYTGTLVVVTYYSLDYSSATQSAESTTLNAALRQVAARFGAAVADGYRALAVAASASNGDSCRAGLLTRLTTGGCGVHPSARGQQLLATAVEQAANGR